MKLSSLKTILAILKRIESNQSLENADDRIKSLERKLNIEIGNREELEKRIRAWEDYWKVSFSTTPKYEKKEM